MISLHSQHPLNVFDLLHGSPLPIDGFSVLDATGLVTGPRNDQVPVASAGDRHEMPVPLYCDAGMNTI